MSWTLTDKLISTQEKMEWFQGAASTTYTKDALYKMSAGLPVALAGQIDQPFLLAQSFDPTPYGGQGTQNINTGGPLRPAADMVTTTAGERIGFVPVTPGLLLDTDLAPLLSAVAAQSNTNAAQAICAYGGSTGDFTGGTVYLPEQNWQGVVTSSAVSGGNVTLAFAPPAPRACTTGDTVCAIPFGVGSAPKFNSSNPHLGLSNAVADNSGGNVVVRKVQGQYGNPKGSLFRITCQIKAPVA